MNEQTPKRKGSPFLWIILPPVFLIHWLIGGFPTLILGLVLLMFSALIFGVWMRINFAGRLKNTSCQNSTSYPEQQLMAQQPQPRYDTRTGVLLPQTPVYSNSTAMSAAAPYPATADGQVSYNPTTDNHLCDDNEHAPESKQSFANTMYRQETSNTMPDTAALPIASASCVMLSADEKRRRIQEYKELLQSGVINKSEYASFVRELT